MSHWRYSVVVRGREVELPQGDSTLGRSRGATISIIDPSISRVHARLQARDGRVIVEDLRSANGTYINGVRLYRLAEVTDGTRLTLGESDLIVRIAKTDTSASTVSFNLRDFLCPRCGKPFPEGRKACPDCAAEAVAEAMLGADPAPGGSVVHGGSGPALLGEASGTGAGSPPSLDLLALDATPLPRKTPPPPPPHDPDATPLPRRLPSRPASPPSRQAAAPSAEPAAKPAARGLWARLFGDPKR